MPAAPWSWEVCLHFPEKFTNMQRVHTSPKVIFYNWTMQWDVSLSVQSGLTSFLSGLLSGVKTCEYHLATFVIIIIYYGIIIIITIWPHQWSTGRRQRSPLLIFHFVFLVCHKIYLLLHLAKSGTWLVFSKNVRSPPGDVNCVQRSPAAVCKELSGSSMSFLLG